jgi:hypothetical protein
MAVFIIPPIFLDKGKPYKNMLNLKWKDRFGGERGFSSDE